MNIHTIDDIEAFVSKIRKEVEEFSNSKFEEEMILWGAFSDIDQSNGSFKCLHKSGVELPDMIAAAQENIPGALSMMVMDLDTISCHAQGLARKVSDMHLSDGTEAEIQILIETNKDDWTCDGCRSW